jgi:hypothetical protein
MKRHRFDLTSFASGVVLAAVAIVYLTAAAQDQNVDARWVVPLALIGVGLAGVAGAVASATRHRDTTTVAVVEPSASTASTASTASSGSSGSGSTSATGFGVDRDDDVSPGDG